MSTDEKLQSCCHPTSAIRRSGEGTNYCGMCADFDETIERGRNEMKVINPSTGEPQSRGYVETSGKTLVIDASEIDKDLLRKTDALENALKIAEEALGWYKKVRVYNEPIDASVGLMGTLIMEDEGSRAQTALDEIKRLKDT